MDHLSITIFRYEEHSMDNSREWCAPPQGEPIVERTVSDPLRFCLERAERATLTSKLFAPLRIHGIARDTVDALLSISYSPTPCSIHGKTARVELRYRDRWYPFRRRVRDNFN